MINKIVSCKKLNVFRKNKIKDMICSEDIMRSDIDFFIWLHDKYAPRFSFCLKNKSLLASYI